MSFCVCMCLRFRRGEAQNNNYHAKELLLFWRIASGIFMLAADIMLTCSMKDKGVSRGSFSSKNCNMQWQVASSPVNRKSLKAATKATIMRLTNRSLFCLLGSLLLLWQQQVLIEGEMYYALLLPCLPHYWEYCKLGDKLVAFGISETHTHSATCLM